MGAEKTSDATWYGPERMWTALQKSFNYWRKKENGDRLTFHPEQKENFIEKFAEYYSIIKTQFMKPNTIGLDTHKQAAILVISALETLVVEQKCEDNEVALGAQAVVLDVALSYLQKSINKKLEEIKMRPIRLKLPEALACETSYFDILRRILYYETPEVEKNNLQYKMAYNILEWSDRFFLLEYITLLENGIDPRLVKDSSRECVK